MANINDVRNYWEARPLFSYEIGHELGSLDFFKEMDRIKREDVERFSMGYWDFPDFSTGKTLLDVGCGPGFLTRLFSAKGYKVTALDLSEKAVRLTRESLRLYSLHADTLVGSAEELIFQDNSFDYVISSGVLHHTPDTRKAILEAYRVLKPGGRAKITLYYKNVLLREPFWSFTKLLSKILLKEVPGRKGLTRAQDPDEFIRIYDGDTNPVGKGYSLKEARALLSPPFIWLNAEIHFFPARFLPRWFPVHTGTHRFLDRHAGTMLYINLRKV